MATMTLTVPDDVKAFLEGNVGEEFASAGEVLAELVREHRDRALSELRGIVDEARSSGVSNRTVADRIAEGDRLLRERGVSVRE